MDPITPPAAPAVPNLDWWNQLRRQEQQNYPQPAPASPNGPGPMSKALNNGVDPYENMHGMPPQGNVAGSVAQGAQDWWKSGQSWADKAHEQSGRDQEAFTQGGVKGMLAQSPQETMDLASGFAGTFGGVTAKTANLDALETALKMKASPRQIWNKTGWFRGVDGKWRFEIPDDTSSTLFGGQSRLDKGAEQPAGDLLHHPDLYEAYPHLHTTPVDANPGEGFQGVSRGGSMGIKPDMDLGQTRSTMLHELQHEIQRKEGFMSGRGPYDMGVDQLQQQMKQINDAHDTLLHARQGLGMGKMEELSKLPPNELTNAIASGHEAASKYWGRQMDPGGFIDELHQSPDQASKQELITDLKKRFEQMPEKITEAKIAQEADNHFYRHQASEVEARNVQKRRDYTPEQRKFRPPWITQDTKEKFQNTTSPSTIPEYVKALRGY